MSRQTVASRGHVPDSTSHRRPYHNHTGSTAHGVSRSQQQNLTIRHSNVLDAHICEKHDPRQHLIVRRGRSEPSQDDNTIAASSLRYLARPLSLSLGEANETPELIDKCVGSRIWVIMKGDKGALDSLLCGQKSGLHDGLQSSAGRWSDSTTMSVCEAPAMLIIS